MTAPFELDHVFVCVSRDAPEATALNALGLTESRSAVHEGQGTANRCFLFRNAYLELIWVHDADEARSATSARIRIFERWQGRDAATCPFGFCFRPSRASSVRSPPFRTWDYVPRYVTASNPIRIGCNAEQVAEPMLFFIESASRPDSWPRQPPLQHRLGVRELSRVTWTRPSSAPLSQELQAVVDAGGLDIAPGEAHALELCFDEASAAGQRVSLAPRLPLSVRWA